MKLVYLDKDKKDYQGIGGKARNLYELDELGVLVPRWVVIPEDVLLSQMLNRNEDGILSSDINRAQIPPEVIEKIKFFFGENYLSKTYAVRSSSIDEDGKEFSFAGLFETFLHVPFDEIETRIKDIWLSVNSERVIKYRGINNLPEQKGIAVIIQEMIEPDVSGVAFGVDPVSGDSSTKIVTAVYGLGEGLVSGDLNADNYTFKNNEISQNIASKTHKYIKDDKKGGLRKMVTDSDLQNIPALDDSQVHEICHLLDRLNHYFSVPQDIEYSYQKGKLFLLQTRPITTIKNEDKGDYILWDNSNIIESYPGITTPLTFSFISKMYEMVYRQFVGLLGVEKKEIIQHSSIFRNTLGLVRGRVYYNLLNWYKMLAMVPGYSINAENMERMMGVKEKFELQEEYQMSIGLAWYRTVKMVFKMIYLHFALPKERKRFKRHLDEVMDYYQKLDFTLLTSHEIIRQYKTFESTLLLKWKAPLINDFFAMIWFGMLEKVAKKYCPVDANIHNDLLCGSQDIISVEPIHRTIALAHFISEDHDAKLFFENNTSTDIWRKLKNGSFPEIKDHITDYIDLFGDRCIGELKLETISYSQRPELFVKVLKTYVEQGIIQKKSSTHIENDLRLKAEEKIISQLSSKPVKRYYFNYILKTTRDLVSNRENLRFERTRGFGMVRNMFFALGNLWHTEGFLENPEDVFYMKLEEITDLENQEFTDELKLSIKDRKEEFKGYKNQEPPQERFYTYGYDFKDEYIYSLEKIEEAEEDLSGVGCCPGIVKGKVRVVINPHEIDSLNGDVLVTSSTDPGWVTLFPTASAIIVERGSLLSHSAIVSREMGIPCIVSVSGLLRTLKTGDLVLMDGSTGKIKLLKDE